MIRRRKKNGHFRFITNYDGSIVITDGGRYKTYTNKTQDSYPDITRNRKKNNNFINDGGPMIGNFTRTKNIP